MSVIEKLIKPHLVKVNTYKPVDPPELLAAKAGIPLDTIIKLNGNENPKEPSDQIKQAVASAAFNIYPDPLQRSVRSALSKYTDMPSDYIIASAGSDELIDLLFRLFISEGDKILDFEPTFAMYGFCARVAGGSVTMAPRDDNFDIDIKSAINAIDEKTKIIFLSSPNNPTGNTADREQIEELLKTDLLVVVDEAYFEFCNKTVVDLIPKYENLVVLRTMSKWAGLAGLRIGYGIMSPELVNHIIDIKSPYNLSVTSEAALIAALNEAGSLMAEVKKIVRERERMYKLLQSIDGIELFPSEGNFILCGFAEGKVDDVYQGLANQGIFVRKFDSPRLSNHFRISVGKPHQTDRLISVIKELV
jgi:histidinol-phosphate aminotransferase